MHHHLSALRYLQCQSHHIDVNLQVQLSQVTLLRNTLYVESRGLKQQSPTTTYGMEKKPYSPQHVVDSRAFMRKRAGMILQLCTTNNLCTKQKYDIFETYTYLSSNGKLLDYSQRFSHSEITMLFLLTHYNVRYSLIY